MEDCSVPFPEGLVIQSIFSPLVRFSGRFSCCVSGHKSACSGGDAAAQRQLF